MYVRCANTQPFLCSDLGPFREILGTFQAILGNLLGLVSGDFRQFQELSGNFRQFRVIFGKFQGPKPKKKRTV